MVGRKGFATCVERIQEFQLGRMADGVDCASARLGVGGRAHGNKVIGNLIDRVD